MKTPTTGHKRHTQEHLQPTHRHVNAQVHIHTTQCVSPETETLCCTSPRRKAVRTPWATGHSTLPETHDRSIQPQRQTNTKDEKGKHTPPTRQSGHASGYPAFRGIYKCSCAGQMGKTRQGALTDLTPTQNSLPLIFLLADASPVFTCHQLLMGRLPPSPDKGLIKNHPASGPHRSPEPPPLHIHYHSSLTCA